MGPSVRLSQPRKAVRDERARLAQLGRAYDHTVALLMWCAAWDADHLLLNTKRAWRDVLEAFADDTAEFNRRETILGCASAPFFEPFLRGLLSGDA